MSTITEIPAGRAPAPGPVDRPAPTSPTPAGRLADAVINVFEQIAGMMILTGKAMVATFSPPYSWKDEFVEESWLVLRRCIVPVVVSTLAFGYGAPGLQASNITSVFGTIDRQGAFFVMASVRELAGWITGMVVAGVAGAAVCADLGARKVREELDAMATLGLDPVREIVTPRFLALGIITPFLNIIALVVAILGGLICTLLIWQDTASGYFATFASNFTFPDLFGAVIKTTAFGFIIAIACCFKGMNVSGGAQGVGRGVNQAVVIAFCGIWAFNNLFTAILLAAFPETGNLH